MKKIGSLTSLIICPTCKKSLEWKTKYALCPNCDKNYQIEKGIIRFLKSTDKFYENVYSRQIRYLPDKNFLKNWAFFNLVQSGILGEIKRVIESRAQVLDIGCAGGIKWLGTCARTVGLDISFASLIKAKEFYADTVQADTSTLPFKNSCFDLIYGSYIFEHLSPEVKERFLKEAHRVLRPGGNLILQFDTLSNNWLTRFALRDQNAYKHGFIDIDNHIGLESLSGAIKRLEKNSFKIKRVVKFGTTILQYEPTYNWLNASCGETVLWVKVLGIITRKIMNNRYGGMAFEFFITLFDKFINPFSKTDSATRAILTAKKI